MKQRIKDLITRIKELENELSIEIENELNEIQKRFEYTVERGRVRFQEGALATQKAFKKNLYRYFRESKLIFFLTAPIIYSVLIPLLLFDLFLTLYQVLCFPVYQIRKVNRKDYLIIDRQHLAYLNLVEKVNCMYCGYANGLLSYALEIGSRTEKYWCPIKHAKKVRDPHSRYRAFLEYGDGEGYKNKLNEFRRPRK
ncbi:hypothetical protein [Desulforhopalus singaporensis]|uniref:Uncharacterized protein n=1 Tax=Desulforhopalus singaporensis TaxID=91360 RepID=A0A1H0W1A8_9BACT|nr:hypothetical protein [Desulforhopalus singaporensis]SDP84146.1 hypothetical protein SAMN05660330_04349 [Desulforhopalus singaporensis]